MTTRVGRVPVDVVLAARQPLLMEGAVVERVRRSSPGLLDPLLVNAPLIYDADGSAALRQIYRDYLAIGHRHALPLLLLAPTWRANPDRLAMSRFAGRDVNGDAVRFVRNIRDAWGDYARFVYVGGLMGCRGDAYKPHEGLTREDARRFHATQASALAAAGADYLLASTMPAVAEAVGMAEALAATGCPYLVSFIIRPSGHVLDGTPLDDAIRRVDDAVARSPVGFLVNCVHSSTVEAALETTGGQRVVSSGRLLGVQANTSSKRPEELDGLETLDAEAAAEFCVGMCRVRDRFGLYALGGCCGTDDTHIAALAAAMAHTADGRECREAEVDRADGRVAGR